MHILNAVYGNGLLSDTAFEAGLESLPTTCPVLYEASAENPLYAVGMTEFRQHDIEANAVGVWVDGDTVYYDPVFITFSEPTAQWLSKLTGQVCYFKATGVVHTEESNTAQLLSNLYAAALKYGGATAIKRGSDHWVIFACEGDCIYP